jgi:SAM-dependent methyltransferase
VSGPLRCACDGRHLAAAFRYDAPPPGETRYELAADAYPREIQRCDLCGHFTAASALDGETLYGDAYVSTTYGDELRDSFARIVALPPERSDNHSRVRRVVDFARERFGAGVRPRVLDVGSGLCVFLHGLAQEGWSGTALDPDPRSAAHAREVVGVDAVCADFLQTEGLGRFDVVTFNKVLEHVADPVDMLARSAENVADGGFVYVEVPDGDAAAAEGADREEFFIEHLHAFSPASLALAVARAGFSPLRVHRLHEPSGKYTLAAFLAP